VNQDTTAPVLVIDDNEHFLVTLRDFLSYEGFRVVTATSGEEALETLEAVEPALIILDISMPGMGGLEFLSRISNDDIPSYPVLVLTARATLRPLFDRIPVDSFIAKPCPEATLLAEIKDILSRQERRVHPGSTLSGRLLLVEDDKETANSLSLLFLSAGFSVDVARGASELLESAIAEQPDLVLLKESLPDIRGHALVPLMNAMPSTRTIPIILYDDVTDSQKQVMRPPPGVARFLPTRDGQTLLEAVIGALQQRSQKSVST
jgi:two-component system CAI-1 autoinducer sensor kinase/phosphatase CqsS